MKHKILLATDPAEGFEHLIEDVLNLLNKTHHKYVSAFSPGSYVSKNLVTVNAGRQSESNQLDDLVDEYEIESILEEHARGKNVDFEWVSDTLDERRLSSLSTVFDLLILDQKSFQNYDATIIDELLETIHCPVLLLPKNWEIENLVVFHDGSMDSVKMVKDFLNLFDPALRNLPLSVLVSHFSDDYDVESEKVFVDYLKLFFNDIGVQLIQGKPMDNLNQSIVYNSQKPFLMIGVQNYEVSGKELMEFPTFFFKG